MFVFQVSQNIKVICKDSQFIWLSLVKASWGGWSGDLFENKYTYYICIEANGLANLKRSIINGLYKMQTKMAKRNNSLTPFLIFSSLRALELEFYYPNFVLCFSISV